MRDLGCPIFGLGVNIGHGAGSEGGARVGRGGWRGGGGALCFRRLLVPFGNLACDPLDAQSRETHLDGCEAVFGHDLLDLETSGFHVFGLWGQLATGTEKDALGQEEGHKVLLLDLQDLGDHPEILGLLGFHESLDELDGGTLVLDLGGLSERSAARRRASERV